MSGSDNRPTVAIVLAAGRGTRMRSEVPKVLHPAAGRPMLEWVLAAAKEAGCERTITVIGHQAEEIRSRFDVDSPCEWAYQHEPNGTGHALAQVRDLVSDEGAILLVLSGDVPLLRPESLRELLAAARAGWGSMAVSRAAEPGSLGRVFKKSQDSGQPAELGSIVEAADATPEQLEHDLINAGLYALPAPSVFDWLDQLDTDNAQGELYLTDAVTAAAASGLAVRLVELGDPAEAFGVNDRKDLARVEKVLVARKLDQLMEAGVTLLDPARTVVHSEVQVGQDTVLHPGVTLLGKTVVGQGCELHQGAWIKDSQLADGIEVKPYSVLESATVGERSKVGPFARLRPGATLGKQVGVGNFVEVKNSELHDGVKAGHLAYLGDATIGRDANIGAGTITCNYDGRSKHRTEIGADSFIGSDTMLVAPVRIGNKATTAAGSTITKDVSDGSLGIGRARQKTLEGWAERQARVAADDTIKAKSTVDS